MLFIHRNVCHGFERCFRRQKNDTVVSVIESLPPTSRPGNIGRRRSETCAVTPLPSSRVDFFPTRLPTHVRVSRPGADIITADKAGNTPLHYASKGGHTEMVKMLVGQGAAVERRNGSRLTAYDVATDHVIRQFLLPLQLKVRNKVPASLL